MSQTTAAIAGTTTKIEYSLNASGTTGTWTDISGYAGSVTPSGGEQITGSTQTMDGNAAIVKGANKTDPWTITFSVVYTDTDAQPFVAIYDRFVGATKTIAVRWSYAGGTSGTKQYFATDAAGTNPVMVPIVSCTPPTAEAGTADPLMFEFSVMAPAIGKATVA